MQFTHFELDNGLQVACEFNPRALSTAIGFFVAAGSRDENAPIAGVSHFLEHMAFKGNERFSAEDVNRIFDEVGAAYNASTSEEVTFFYAAVLPEYAQTTFDLLANLLRPSLRTTDFDTEKQVILEEIGMYDDLPSFLIYERAMGIHFQGHPLGQSVLGSKESVGALSAEQMRAYHHERYGAANITLAACGAISPAELRDLAQQYCGDWQRGSAQRALPPISPVSKTEWIVRPSIRQQHLMSMASAPAADDPLRFAAEILSVIVGDDDSGRMYWDLVDTGLTESAELSFSEYGGAGAWLTYASFEPQDLEEVRERIMGIFFEINRDGVTEDEFEQARNKVASRVVLRGERPMGRLTTVGSDWLYRREYRSVADDLATIRSLTRQDISQLLERYPLKMTTTVGLGPLNGNGKPVG